MKNVTIEDVAKRAGFSKATVSAVLNNKDVVAEATRRTILEAIEALNYRPRNAPARPGDGRRKCLGFVIKEAANPYYAEALEGIRAYAAEKGYLVLVGSSEGSFEQERALVEKYVDYGFDGLILTPILSEDSDLSHVFELKRRNVPFVLLERVRGLQADLVDVDNVLASCMAVRHLIDQGHTRIAHFAGPRYSIHSEERIEGVRQAFSETRHVFDRDLVVYTGDALADGYREGLRFFGEAGDDRPTAVTCYNDLVAIGLMKALSELGLRVPEDVSVVGFDDLELLKYLPVPLTSVRVPKQEMGRNAAEILIRRIESARTYPVQKVAVDAQLVLRASTRSLDAPPVPPPASDDDGTD